MDDIVFREMTLSDREKIIEFYHSLSDDSASFFNIGGGNERRSLDFFDAPRPNHRFFVAEVGDIIAGHLFIWDTDVLIPWLGIGVRDDFQGKRIGSMMLEKLFELLKNEGYGGLMLRTAQNNTAAQRLYERRGFERIGVHPSGEYLYIKRFNK